MKIVDEREMQKATKNNNNNKTKQNKTKNKERQRKEQGGKRSYSEKQNKTKQKTKKDRKEQGGKRSYSERVRAKRFYCAFKLDFFQLICNASLIFKLNLELALSIILKQRGLYESFLIIILI